MNKQGAFLGIPCNREWTGWKKINERIWNKSDHRLFPPKAYGWGYAINFYELFHHRRQLLTVSAIVLVLIVVFALQQARQLSKAHSTFENYYAFRGCRKLLKRTDAYGICKTGNGQAIKIVKFNGKWYLDGDLPVCFLHICL